MAKLPPLFLLEAARERKAGKAMKRGRLIVLRAPMARASPPSLARLCRRAEHEGIAFSGWCFPSIRRSPPPLLRMYLNGEFGRKLRRCERLRGLQLLRGGPVCLLEEGMAGGTTRQGLVLADRYTTSNAVHQFSKVPRRSGRRSSSGCLTLNMAGWACRKPDLVLYRTCPRSGRWDMLRQRERDTHTQGDIHETDSAYLATCRQGPGGGRAIWLDQDSLPGSGGTAPAIDEIHQDIWQAVRPLLETKER